MIPLSWLTFSGCVIVGDRRWPLLGSKTRQGIGYKAADVARQNEQE